MGDGVAQAGEEFAIVSEDVAIVDGDHAGLFAGEHVTEAEPDIAALAGGAGLEFGVFQGFAEGAQAGAVVPQEDWFLGERTEEAAGASPFLDTGGAVDADDDLADIPNLPEFAKDHPECAAAEFADVAGQDKGDGRLGGELGEFALEAVDIRNAETVERGDGARLKEIGHDNWIGTQTWRVAARPLETNLRRSSSSNPWMRRLQ